MYHYAGNNPVRYTDPDGRNEKNAVAGKVDGQRKYGKVSNELIELLKRIETPTPDKDGKIGLHMAGDGTVTDG